MRLAVCIPCYNEEANISNLLSSLKKTKQFDAIFVISAATDRTDEIVREHASSDMRIVLVPEKKRGKTLAVNIALKLTRSYDAVLFLGGDNAPTSGSVEKMVSYLLEEKCGIVSSRQIPVDSPNSFMGFMTHLQWNIHHEICKVLPKVSGELFLMRTGIIEELPLDIINDDQYIQDIFERRGYRVDYVPEAQVRLKGPGNLSDFFRQRIRVFIGHHQLRALFHKKEPTSPINSLKVWRKSLPYATATGYLYGSAFMLFQGITFGISYVAFRLGYLPYKWSTPVSTKVLEKDC